MLTDPSRSTLLLSRNCSGSMTIPNRRESWPDGRRRQAGGAATVGRGRQVRMSSWRGSTSAGRSSLRPRRGDRSEGTAATGAAGGVAGEAAGEAAPPCASAPRVQPCGLQRRIRTPCGAGSTPMQARVAAWQLLHLPRVDPLLEGPRDVPRDPGGSGSRREVDQPNFCPG